MTRIALLAAGCAVLALAACDHPDAKRQHEARVLKSVSKLDCPDKQGALTRVSVAPDGQSCVYSGNQSEVTLRIVKLENGDAAKGLAPIEADLRTLVPKIEPDAAAKTAASNGESVDIKLPGVSIQANDGGANIRAGGAIINADDNGAEVRVSRNIEIDGETVQSERQRRRNAEEGVMALLILANEKTETDWNVVGYSARGPKGGPLVVGVVKSKDRNSAQGDDDLFEDVDKLIRHNVGGRGMRGLHISG